MNTPFVQVSPYFGQPQLGIEHSAVPQSVPPDGNLSLANSPAEIGKSGKSALARTEKSASSGGNNMTFLAEAEMI